MKLAISNLAWGVEQDEAAYEKMQRYGFSGLEIAPTRIFPVQPYQKLDAAREWSKKLREKCGFAVPSLQSIWYGRKEHLFGDGKERETLKEYTAGAIAFAEAVGAKNIVFGSPKNRALPEGHPELAQRIGVPFFSDLAIRAASAGVTVGIEANPPIYGTNYLTRTQDVLSLLQGLRQLGIGLNLDVGTMVENHESAEMLRGYVHEISHVHISEPYLVPVQSRPLHKALAKVLREEGYGGFVSIEMKRVDDLSVLDEAMAYVKEVFGNEDL